MNIIKKLSPNFSDRGGYKPEVIVVHISAGTLDSMTSWFSSVDSQVSAHYGVGKDGRIMQYVEEINKAWHAGNISNPTFKLFKGININPNNYTIGIENEGMDLSQAPALQLDTLCNLIKDIASRWNIPLDRDHIIGHYQINGTVKANCPSPDHTVIDRLIMPRLVIPIVDEQVCLKVPKSRLDIINKFLSSLK